MGETGSGTTDIKITFILTYPKLNKKWQSAPRKNGATLGCSKGSPMFSNDPVFSISLITFRVLRPISSTAL